MRKNIHPSASIADSVTLGKDVIIEQNVVIKGQTTIGDRVTVKANVYIDGNVTIGEDTVLWPGAVIGTQTQAIKYAGETTYVQIGKRCQIREYVTINSSYGEGDVVSVGDDCLIMAYCHIAHHCHVGNSVIMSNAVNLAGHVIIEDEVVIGGMSAFHQNTRVGRYAMVGGMSRVLCDVPPYTVGGGIPYKIGGVNRVGLQRKNFSGEQKKELVQIFNTVYRNPELSYSKRLEELEEKFSASDLGKQWIQFCKASKRGLIDT